MAPVPRPRKPVPTVRRVAKTSRRPAFQLPPALISAVVVAALGAAGWWLLQPGASPGPDVPADEELAEAPPAAVPAAPAVAVPAAAVAAAEPTKEPVTTDAPAPADPKPAAAEPAFARLLVLDAMGGAKKENQAWADEAWKQAKTTGAWDDYRKLLARSLQALAARGMKTAEVVAGKWSGPALIRHAFLHAVPGDLLQPLLTHEETGPFVSWLLEQPEAMQTFVRQLTPQDDVEKALALWAGIAEENPSARGDYLELAVACALVFDEKVKVDKDRYDGAIDGVERFRYFQTNDEAGRLTGKIKRMTAADLVWVVGVPVSAKELEWALKEADFRRKTWGQAYGTIKYDMDKAVTGKGSYDEYTFAEIKKKGGICSDQSYFTAWTACAHGIPAAIIGGDGARGAHAWITWQSDENEWKFSGRFDGYPAGRTRNPQTRETISEEEFLRLSDKKAASPPLVLKARQALWMAQVFADQPDRALEFITEAVKAAPLLEDPAVALLNHWTQHRAAAPPEEWAALLKDLRKDFRDAAHLMEIAAEAETKFVFSRQETAATLKDLKREAKKVDDTAATGTGVAVDLERLTTGLKRQAEVFHTNQNPDGIRSLYRRALADHGDDAATFKALARDYFAFFQADAVLAAKACRELEMACRRSVGRGKGDWFDITSQNSAWRVVADCYRAAGETDKATRIVKDCDDRESMAKKRAI